MVEAARLNAQGMDLSSLIKSLRQPVESTEMRFSITHDHFLEYGRTVLENLHQEVGFVSGWKIVTPNYEGLRVQCTNPEETGWFLIRMSLHDPVMPLNIESDVAGGTQCICNRLMELLKKYSDLKS